jgi:transcriptional regulator with XRE-family HTH domain
MATVGMWSGRETRALREALRMSVRNFAAYLGVNERTITKWESGSSAVRPRPELQAALDTALERASDDVVARFEAARQPAPVPIDLQTLPALGRDTTFPELRDVISVAAAESTKFLMWAEMENVGDLTLEQLQSEVRRVARAYSHESPEPLFLRARMLRDRAFALLEGQHRPSYARDLYAVAGWSLTILAWISLDFDRPDAAEDHARAAWLCAERADYDDLRAWVRARQATAAFFLDDFHRAAEYAADGLRYATGSAALLLASARATHLAHAGKGEQAWEALRQAIQFAETIDQSGDELGGLFTCDIDRASGFWSETQLQLGAADLALEQVDRGVAVFEAQPPDQRNLSSERYVRLQQVRAHLVLGQLDGAEAALAPVLETPPEWRVRNLMRRMNTVYAAAARYADEPISARIREAALGFQREATKKEPPQA